MRAVPVRHTSEGCTSEGCTVLRTGWLQVVAAEPDTFQEWVLGMPNEQYQGCAMPPCTSTAASLPAASLSVMIPVGWVVGLSMTPGGRQLDSKQVQLGR